MDLSVIAIIGILLLIGIVKKNAIMMVDFALERRREGGMDALAAIREAALIRFRPIIMTTLAALLGALPIALGTGAGSELRQPLGVAIVGGLCVSQLLTLYITPVVYYLPRQDRFGARRPAPDRAQARRGEGREAGCGGRVRRRVSAERCRSGREGATIPRRSSARQTTPQRRGGAAMYPPEVEILDDRFAKLALDNVRLEKLYTGCRWAEGPAYFAAGKYLVWSDIPNDRVLRYDETNGAVSVFLAPADNHNGHTVDRQGRLVSCEHRTRCVSRIEHDGTRRVLADRFEGKRLNSPNDVVVKSDGSIWFTDPTYGIDSDYEGDAAPRRSAPATSIASIPKAARSPPRRPISSSPTASPSRPTRSCSTSPTPASPTSRTARAISASPKSAPTAARSAPPDCSPNAPPACSTASASTPKATSGPRPPTASTSTRPTRPCSARSRFRKSSANVCFGGPKRNRLYICATTSLYAIYVNARGASWPS